MFSAVLSLGVFFLMPGAATSQPEVEAQQVRVFSVGSLLAEGVSSDTMAMLPYVWNSQGSMPAAEEGESGPAMDVQELMELCRTVVDPEVWDRGDAWMDVRGGSRRSDYEIVVAGPTPVLEEMERFLGFLQENLVATERLEVRVYGGDVDATEPMLQDQSQSRERLDAMVQAGKLQMLRSGSVLLGDDHSQQIDAADVEPLVLGWESVIASGAAVAQAVEFVVGTGLTLFVKAEPTEGGTLLDLLLRESEHLAPPEVDRLLTNSTINAKTALTPQRAVGIVERPRVAFASFAGSAVLPPGKALLLPVALETVTGGVHYVVDLRITGKVRPAHASFLMAGRDDPDAPSRVDLFHLGHWSTEGVRCAGISASTLGPDMYLEEEETLVSSYLEPLGLDLLADFVRGALPEFQDRESYSLWNRNSQLWAVSSPDVADRILRMCNSVAPPLTTFEVSGRIRVGDREVGRFQLPLLSRRPAALWSGVQSMALDSWSIEVAQDASTAYPSFRALLDGFALSLEPAPAPDGSAWLRVKAKLNFLREPPRMLDLETDDNRRITKSRTRSVFVEDSVQTDPEGSSRFVFGSDPSLELEVRARR